MAKLFAREKRRNSLVAIIGPTASGKSELGVRLAKKFNGEIVSADSRQVYKGLDIGSSKITKKEMRSVPHHLLNVASPRRKFTVAQYQKLAFQAIREIQRRNKLPFLLGGSPFYVYAVIDSMMIPEVKPNTKLRRQLTKLSATQLYEKLTQVDPERARSLQESSGEAQNPRRLIRALEIVMSTGNPVPKLDTLGEVRLGEVRPLLLIGIERSPEELRKRIRKRLLYRIDHGMVNEVRKLKQSGLSGRRLEEFGLEYRNVAQYLQGTISKQEMIERIQKSSEHFARRQMAWFRRDPRIHWISSYSEAARVIKRSFASLHSV